MASDLAVLKEIPGYKAILKSVLKSQIQMLMEQLSDQTGEESIILTASVHDGSLSHLGSSTGKGFLEGRDEIKAQFLGYCLKSQHRKESLEAESQQYNRSRTLMPPARRQRPRIRPSPYSISSPGVNTSAASLPSFAITSPHVLPSLNQSNNMNIKQETVNAADNFLDSVTDDKGSEFPGADNSGHVTQAANQNESFDSSQSSSHDDPVDSVQAVKIEAVEPDGELEVTGVEIGDNSLSSSENWGQSYSSSGQNDGSQGEQNSFNASLAYRRDGFFPNQGYGDPLGNAFQMARSAKQFPMNRTENRRLSSDSGCSLGSQESVGGKNTAQQSAFVSSCAYKCVPCGQKFITKSQHVNHLFDAHNIPHYDCEFCGRRFRMRQQMETHRRTHTGEKPYKCPDCDNAYTNAAAFNYHRTKVHLLVGN